MKRKVTLQGLALLLALGTTTNVFASVKNDIKIEVVGGGDIDIYNNKEDTNSKDTLNQKEENKSIPYSQDEYQYLQINFSEPFTEERYLELINNKESFIVSDSRLASTRSTTTPIYLNSSTFPDKVLRDKLQTIFSVSSDNVDVSYKVLTTTTLRLQGDFSNTGIHITNIKGLEHFTNLTDLYLSNNKINSISSIKDLVNLETLYINGASNYGLTINFRCNIDASDLSKLVNLKTLNLSDCNITSVDKIGNLIELEDLDLASTNINNISFVSKLGELKSLDLSDVDNKLSLSPISKLINLKNLDLVNKNSSAIINTNFAQYLPKSREVIRLYVEKGANFTSYLNGHQKAYEDIDCTDSSIDWNPSSGRGVTVYVKTEIPLSIKSVTVVDKYWDNTTKAEIENVVFSGLENGDTLTKGVDYTVNATYDNSNLGSSKQVIGTINLLSTNKTNRYKLSSSTFQTTGNIIKGNSNLDNIKIKNSKGSETTTFDFSDRLIVEATPKIRANLNEMELVLNNQVISKQSATLNNKVTFNVDLSTLTIGQGNYELKLRYGGNNNVNGTEQSLGNITINKTKIKAEINESIEYNGKDTFELELKNIKNKNDDTTINGIIGSATIQLNSSNVGNYSNFIVNKVSINGDTYNHYEFENQNTDITGNINITKKPITINSVIMEDKKYDGNRNGTVTIVIFDGLIGGQRLEKDIDYNATAVFDDENVGNDKQVTVNVNLLGTQKANNYQLTNNTFQTVGNILKSNSTINDIKIKNNSDVETTTFDFSDRLIVEATPRIRANLNEMELVLNNQVISKQSATLNNKVTFNVDLSTLTIGQGNYELKLRYGGNNNVNGTEQSLGNITINKVKIKAEINESIEYNGKDTFEVELKNIKNKDDDTTINGIIGSANIQLNSSNVGNYSNFKVNKVSINGDTYNHYEFENQNTDITGSANITKANIKDILAEIYVTNKLEKDYIFNLEESLPILENNKTFGNLSFSNLNYNEIVKSYLKETPIIDKNNLKLKVNKFISEEEKLLGEITLDVTSTNYNDFKLKLNLNSTNKLKPILNVYQKDTLTYGDNLKKLNLDFTATYGNEIVDGTINVNEDLESILDAGNHKISVTFIPTDNNKYDVVDGYVDIKIQKALAKVIEKPEITKITDSGKMLSESKFITKGKFQGINNEIINENDYTLKWENEDEIIIQGKPYKYNMISNNYYIIEEHTPFELSDNNNGGDNNSNNNNNNSNSSSGNNNVNNDGDYTGSGSNVVDNGNNTVNNPNTEDISNGNKEYNNTENDNLFEDLSNDHSAKNEINYLFEKGIIKGYNGLIRPNDYMTRAEFSILLNNTCKYLGVDTNNLADDSYTDVYKDKYYYNDIYKATYLDTMIGYDDGTFKPDNNMTREESIVSIYKLISLCNLDMELSYPINFNDYEQVSVWAKPYFDELNSKSILKGDNNGNFKPKDSITRAEAMVLIYGILNK